MGKDSWGVPKVTQQGCAIREGPALLPQPLTRAGRPHTHTP